MSAEPLVLVGAGPLARETASAVAALNAVTPSYEILGLVDDDPSSHGEIRAGHRVLGGIVDVVSSTDARVVICTGSPTNWWSRTLLARRLAIEPERYATIVHPSVSLGVDTLLGHGTILLAGCVTTASVDVGAHVVAMPGVILTHDDRIGDGVTFGSGVRLGGGVVVERGAYLGAGSLVREGLAIGAWAFLGMGSVLLESLPSAEVWVGSPAHHLRSAAVPADVLAGAV